MSRIKSINEVQAPDAFVKQAKAGVNADEKQDLLYVLNHAVPGLKLYRAFETENKLLTFRVASVYATTEDGDPTCPAHHDKSHIKTSPFSLDYSKCPLPPIPDLGEKA